MLIPETVRHLSSPWPLVFSLSHQMVWIPMLLVLLHRARRLRLLDGAAAAA